MKDVRDFALTLPETRQEPHFEKTSIRVCGKICITLSGEEHFVVKLNLDDQSILVDMFPENFRPNKGWGKHGWTEVTFKGLTKDQMEGVVIKAWKTVAPKRLSKMAL